MSEQIRKIVIVGGGSAGWMTASTLVERLVGRDITLIESPNIPTVGVGESTLGFINNWMSLLNIKDEEWMKHCDATYKLSIRFTDFYKKDSGSFHYPFGGINTDGNKSNKNDWYFKKILHPQTPVSDYADCIYPIMSLVNENKISVHNVIPDYNFKFDAAYHMDAVKFGIWLRDYYAKPRGVKHIQSEVTHVETSDNGIDYVTLTNGDKISADLFIDCTGFASILLGKALNESFIPFDDILPNNSAWAAQIPYDNKREEIVPYTDCHAIGNGWVWNTPLWSRLGTGYVYSDKYISDEDALEEFKDHLRSKGKLREDQKFRKLKFRVGTFDRLWVKNVCAIGLSAGFIEPLESNGLFSVHEFLIKLVRALDRFEDCSVSQFDKDAFNMVCKIQFKSFAEFVALHYALSHRDDTEYWKDIGKREYLKNSKNKDKESYGFIDSVSSKYERYAHTDNGLNCIGTGLNYFPMDTHSLMYHNDERNWLEFLQSCNDNLNKKKEAWKDAVKNEPHVYDYLKEKIYND